MIEARRLKGRRLAPQGMTSGSARIIRIFRKLMLRVVRTKLLGVIT